MNSEWDEEQCVDGMMEGFMVDPGCNGMMEGVISDTFSLVQPSERSDSLLSIEGEMNGIECDGAASVPTGAHFIPKAHGQPTPAASQKLDDDSSRISQITSVALSGDDSTTTISSSMFDDDDDGDGDDKDGASVGDPIQKGAFKPVQTSHPATSTISGRSPPFFSTPPTWKKSDSIAQTPQIEFLGTPPTFQAMTKEFLSPKPVPKPLAVVPVSSQPPPSVNSDSVPSSTPCHPPSVQSHAPSTPTHDSCPTSELVNLEPEDASILGGSSQDNRDDVGNGPMPSEQILELSSGDGNASSSAVLENMMDDLPGLACFPLRKVEGIVKRSSRCILFPFLLKIKEGDKFLFQTIDPFSYEGQKKVVESEDKWDWGLFVIVHCSINIKFGMSWEL